MAVASKKMTYAEFLEWDFPEGDTAIYELIKGEIVRRASPNTPHQRLAAKLFLHLGLYNQQKNLGQLFFAPYDVYLDEYNAGIQPDILFVSHERAAIIRENNGVVGAPDLIVEIISKGTAAKDRGDKKDIYEEFGVREYWIADPLSRSIEIYTLTEGRFRLSAYAAEEGAVSSSVLSGLELDVTLVFD